MFNKQCTQNCCWSSCCGLAWYSRIHAGGPLSCVTHCPCVEERCRPQPASRTKASTVPTYDLQHTPMAAKTGAAQAVHLKLLLLLLLLHAAAGTAGMVMWPATSQRQMWHCRCGDTELELQLHPTDRRPSSHTKQASHLQHLHQMLPANPNCRGTFRPMMLLSAAHTQEWPAPWPSLPYELLRLDGQNLQAPTTSIA